MINLHIHKNTCGNWTKIVWERQRENRVLVLYSLCDCYRLNKTFTWLGWCVRENTPKEILIETVNKFKHIGCSPKKLGYPPQKTIGCFFSKWHLKLKLNIKRNRGWPPSGFVGFQCYFRWPPYIRGPKSHKTMVNTSNCHTFASSLIPEKWVGMYRPPKNLLWIRPSRRFFECVCRKRLLF